MKPRVRSLAAALCGSITGLLLTAGAGMAAAPITLEPGVVQVMTFGGPSSTVLPLQVDQLYPGATTEARFLLRRGSGFMGGTFAVSVNDVRDFERGCNRPEIHAGDTTCGDGDDQGELSDQLLIAHSWSSGVASCADVPGPAVALPLGASEDLMITTPATLSTAAEVCLVVELSLPFSADNLVQSDLVTFDLSIGLQDAVPASGRTPLSGGEQASAERPANVSSETKTPPSDLVRAAGATGRATASLVTQPRTLPFTGGVSALLAFWAMLAIIFGRALVRANRRPA